MTPKHSPGPWIAEGGDGHGGRWIGSQEGVHIASVNLPIHDTQDLTKAQAEANAILIKEAPNLLAVLIRAADAIASHRDHWDLSEEFLHLDVVAAIKKATL